MSLTKNGLQKPHPSFVIGIYGISYKAYKISVYRVRKEKLTSVNQTSYYCKY